jgi:hypothetical protein
MDVGKFLWGVAVAILFVYLLVRFVIGAVRAQDVRYNWLGVLLSFSTVGLVIYLVFFRQL